MEVSESLGLQAKMYMTYVGELIFRISLYSAYDSIDLMGKIILLLSFLVFSFPSYSNALCVTVDQANLRAEPSADAQLTWTVGKYMPLVMVKQKGAWYQVKDFEGKKMWIFNKLVSSKIDCAVVSVDKTTLREGPGTNFGKTPLGLAHKYMPFKKLDRDGAWLKLQDDFGYRHWVYEKNLWEPLAYAQITY